MDWIKKIWKKKLVMEAFSGAKSGCEGDLIIPSPQNMLIGLAPDMSIYKTVTIMFLFTASVASSGSGGSSPENSNYLRVSAAFGQRRLSDNVLTAPGHRRLSGF